MNKQLLIEVAKESARFERAVALLYLQLSRTYTDDRDFWLQLYSEEKNHEAIFASFAIGELPLSLLPPEIIDTDLERIRKNIDFVNNAVARLDRDFGTKDKAYQLALAIESQAGEAIFQEALSKESDSEALYFIKRINKDEFDHRKRIETIVNKRMIKRRILK
jgi:hypothetical protein